MGAWLVSILLCAACAPTPPAPAPRPKAPDNVRVRNLGVRGAQIGWSDRNGERAWTAVERRDPGKDTFERVGILPPGTDVWTDWGLMPDSIYRYRLEAFDEEASSGFTSTFEVKTDSTTVPEPCVTVFDRRAVSPGATLFNVEDRHDVHSTSVVMAVDEEGVVLWHFEQPSPFVSETDIFPDGRVLAQVGPAVSRLDRCGDVDLYVDDFFLHHDIDVLPWGNLIAITSLGLKERGEAPSDGYSRDWIVEFEPSTHRSVRTIHFEFLVPHEELCLACIPIWVVGGDDWLHVNALDYALEEEALYVSVRNLNRIYKLTYPEAEVEWIMGDGGEFGEGLFSHQHNPYRIAPGRMLIFDNGLHRDPVLPDRSRVIEVEYDPEIPDARIVWTYDGPPDFFSEAQGDATRLPNGNTLVVISFEHRILEISPEGLPVWELVFPPPYLIYKAHRIENFP